MSHSPDIATCLREGWSLYTHRPALLSGATAVVALINALVSWIPLANLLTYPVLLAGLYLLVMRIEQREEVSLGVLFDALPQVLPLVLASLLSGLLIAIGMFLLVIPGIYLAIAYGFTTLHIIDGGLDFWPAMEASRREITQHFLSYVGLGLILIALIVAGAMVFGVGLLVALPVCVAAHYRFYRRLHEA